MELNKQSIQALKQVNKRIKTTELVAYSRKNYTCEIDKHRIHRFYNEKNPEEYIPPVNYTDFVSKHKNLAKSLAIKKLLQRKKIAAVILQVCSYANLTTKHSYKCISGFKPSSI